MHGSGTYAQNTDGPTDPAGSTWHDDGKTNHAEDNLLITKPLGVGILASNLKKNNRNDSYKNIFAQIYLLGFFSVFV